MSCQKSLVLTGKIRSEVMIQESEYLLITGTKNSTRIGSGTINELQLQYAFIVLFLFVGKGFFYYKKGEKR
jgi:hypothetical protein